MIYSVNIVNNSGQPRLIKFYAPIDIQTQQDAVKEIYTSILSKSPGESNLLPLPESLKSKVKDTELRVIYRLYATLYFVVIFDNQESELGIYDLIQVFVESLDKCFANVSELDIVFGWETVETVLEDLIQGGLTLETNPQNVIDAVDSANGQTSSGNIKQQNMPIEGVSFSRWGPVRVSGNMGDTVASASKAWTDVTATLRSFLPGS